MATTRRLRLRNRRAKIPARTVQQQLDLSGVKYADTIIDTAYNSHFLSTTQLENLSRGLPDTKRAKVKAFIKIKLGE